MITNAEFKTVRKILGLSQIDFGDKIGLSREYVGLIERGEKEVSAGTSAIVELLLLKENKVINYTTLQELLGSMQTKTSSQEEPKEDVSQGEDINSAIRMYRSNLKEDIAFRQLTSLRLDKLERMILHVTSLIEKASEAESDAHNKGSEPSESSEAGPKPSKRKQSR